MPILLLMVFLVVHVAVWLHATQIARAAAQEGARAARMDQGSAAAGKARAEDFLAQLGGNVLINRHVTATIDGQTVTVEVQGDSMAVLPFLHLPVDSTAGGPVERFRNPDEAP